MKACYYWFICDREHRELSSQVSRVRIIKIFYSLHQINDAFKFQSFIAIFWTVHTQGRNVKFLYKLADDA